MKYLLDTNICIHFFRGKFNLLDKVKKIGLENCAISEITLAELAFGAENSLYGKEKVRLRKKGQMISAFDLLIGSTAVANQLIMVTENVKEFNRIEDIKIENWIER